MQTFISSGINKHSGQLNLSFFKSAFGGSKPTADFFRKSTAPPPQSQQLYGSDEDERSKWQSLDETEKKKVAAQAYEAFEKVGKSVNDCCAHKPKQF